MSTAIKLVSVAAAFASILSPAERVMIDKLVERRAAEGDAYKIEKITRKSEKEFDVEMECEVTTASPTGKAEPLVYGSTEWLPLAVIRAVTWPRYADMSDYPMMVAEGDWSGIRDSSRETKWEIFAEAGRELLQGR